jgi:Mrp family chromosome partitioning ATPase
MLELLHALEREMPRRILVFDMPPLLASDDVLAFAPQIDALLLVVSEGVTGRNLLRGAQEILSEMNLAGVVLNRSRERNDTAYY